MHSIHTGLVWFETRVDKSFSACPHGVSDSKQGEASSQTELFSSIWCLNSIPGSSGRMLMQGCGTELQKERRAQKSCLCGRGSTVWNFRVQAGGGHLCRRASWGQALKPRKEVMQKWRQASEEDQSPNKTREHYLRGKHRVELQSQSRVEQALLGVSPEKIKRASTTLHYNR